MLSFKMVCKGSPSPASSCLYRSRRPTLSLQRPVGMPKNKLSEQYICIVLKIYLFSVNLVSPK
jgi:hypothetical protein